MDLIPLFATAILVATIASIVLAIASYVAYKAREKRRPNRRFDPQEVQQIAFFHRYVPGEPEWFGTEDDPGSTGTDGRSGG